MTVCGSASHFRSIGRQPRHFFPLQHCCICEKFSRKKYSLPTKACQDNFMYFHYTDASFGFIFGIFAPQKRAMHALDWSHSTNVVRPCNLVRRVLYVLSLNTPRGYWGIIFSCSQVIDSVGDNPQFVGHVERTSTIENPFLSICV